MSKRRPMIYIAGPMTANSALEWHENCLAGIRLIPKIVLDAGATPYCPHAHGLLLMDCGSYGDWIECDDEAIRRCDAIWMLPGWPSCEVATREFEFANELDLEIFIGVDDSMVDMVKLWVAQWKMENR